MEEPALHAQLLFQTVLNAHHLLHVLSAHLDFKALYVLLVLQDFMLIIMGSVSLALLRLIRSVDLAHLQQPVWHAQQDILDLLVQLAV